MVAKRMITFKGETLCLGEWAKRCGVAVPVMIMRLRRWPLERAVTSPKGSQSPEPKKYNINGEWLTVKQMAERSGLSIVGIRSRMYKGMTPVEAMNHERRNRRKNVHGKMYELDGVTKNMTGWAEQVGVSLERMRQLLQKMSIREAVIGPRPPGKLGKRAETTVKLRGKKITVRELAEKAGVSKQVMRVRLKTMTPEEAVAMPARKRGRPRKEKTC